MSKRNLHVPKSKAHQLAYRDYIETLDYEPTLDERLNFGQTNQTGEELQDEQTTRKRPTTAGESLKHHFAQHWPTWALALVGMAIVYLLYDSRVASDKASTQIKTQSTLLNETRSVVRESEKKDQEQEVKLAENSVKLDSLGRRIDETKEEVKGMRSDVQSAITLLKSQQPPERDK